LQLLYAKDWKWQMVGFAVVKINFSCVFAITAHIFIRKLTKKVNKATKL